MAAQQLCLIPLFLFNLFWIHILAWEICLRDFLPFCSQQLTFTCRAGSPVPMDGDSALNSAMGRGEYSQNATGTRSDVTSGHHNVTSGAGSVYPVLKYRYGNPWLAFLVHNVYGLWMLRVSSSSHAVACRTLRKRIQSLTRIFLLFALTHCCFQFQSSGPPAMLPLVTWLLRSDRRSLQQEE